MSHPKGKLFWQSDTVLVGRDMFRALDFTKLIWRLDINLKNEKSFSRLGIVVMKSVRNSSMSSAYAASLYCLSFISTSLMSGLARSLQSIGSKVSTNMKGTRGNPGVFHSTLRRRPTRDR